jgi:hypothetical protein
MSAKERTADRQMFAAEYAVKTIELLPCGYHKGCRVNNCKRRAIVIARSYDSGGRPLKQYELCQQHADQVVEREKGRGRDIVTRS